MSRRYRNPLAIGEAFLAVLLIYLMSFGGRLTIMLLRAVTSGAAWFTAGNYPRWFGLVDNVMTGLILVTGAVVIRFQRQARSMLGLVALCLEVTGYLVVATPSLLPMVYGATYPLRLARPAANPVLFRGAALMLVGLALSKAAGYFAQKYGSGSPPSTGA